MGNKREKRGFFGELRRDWNTQKSLHGKQKLEFFLDYYKWPVIGCIFVIVVICVIANTIYKDRTPNRLRVCVVLNTDDDCSAWFQPFIRELESDGKPGTVDVNLDQPFDSNNRYAYAMQAEIMSTVDAKRLDFAICNKDLYDYLLSLNACLPLDTGISQDLSSYLADQDLLVYSTANLSADKNGNVDPEDGIDGYYGVDLTGTAFAQQYNQTEGETQPLYGVIIANTEHLQDCEALLRALVG
jgi:hypothetical protein